MELDHVSISTATLGGNFVLYWLVTQLAEEEQISPTVKRSGNQGRKGRPVKVGDRKWIQISQMLLLITGLNNLKYRIIFSREFEKFLTIF